MMLLPAGRVVIDLVDGSRIEMPRALVDYVAGNVGRSRE